MAILRWNSASSGDWSVAANWTPPRTPLPRDSVTIDPAGASSPFTVADDLAAAKIGSLDLGTSFATLDIGAHLETGDVPAFLKVTSDLRNQGTIEIRDDGLLKLVGVEFPVNGGTIEVDARVSGTGLVLDNSQLAGAVNLHTGSVMAIASSSRFLSGTLTGNGTLLVAAGATLHVSGDTISLAGGVIEVHGNAGASSVFLLEGGTAISGCTLRSTADGQFEAASFLPGNILTNVTITSATRVVVDDSGQLALSGTILNHGTIRVEASGAGGPNETDLNIFSTVALSGHGTIILSDHAENVIAIAGTLDNIDNQIAGAGAITSLPGTIDRLINEKKGVIDATGTNGLSIDLRAGGTLINHGTIEADGSGGLVIANALLNDGMLFANTGNVVAERAVTGGGIGKINTGTLEFGGVADAKVDFTGDAGLLKLDDSQDFTGTVAGLSQDGGNAIDLGDVSFAGLDRTRFHANPGGTGGRLIVASASGATASFILLGDYVGAFDPAPGNPGFVLADDGGASHGTLVRYYASAPVLG